MALLAFGNKPWPLDAMWLRWCAGLDGYVLCGCSRTRGEYGPLRYAALLMVESVAVLQTDMLILCVI